LLNKILAKDKVASIMEEIRGPAGRTMWDKLGNVNEEILANFLKNEHPQTIAVVLSKIKAEHASRVLGVMSDTLAMEVVMRMIKMESLQKEVLEDVERTLRVEFMNNLSRSSRRDNHELVAEIFNFFDRSTETKFIHSLEQQLPDSAEKVKALMFTFDDLSKLDNPAIQTLMRLIDKAKLGLALKGATETVRTLFMRNMSERASKILKEEMETMGPVRVRDVEDAQAAIILVVKDAANRGEIVIHKDDEDDQMIG
jgi:flagellar motor switch protein FliG